MKCEKSADPYDQAPSDIKVENSEQLVTKLLSDDADVFLMSCL